MHSGRSGENSIYLGLVHERTMKAEHLFILCVEHSGEATRERDDCFYDANNVQVSLVQSDISRLAAGAARRTRGGQSSNSRQSGQGKSAPRFQNQVSL